MAAPRATQFIALRNLARGSQQVRQLHMTGPATYASPVLTRERSILHLPRDIAGLRAECKRRKIDPSGSESDLISRLNADELAHTRSFSTQRAGGSRPTVTSPPAAAAAASATPARTFNTSRTLKAVNDNSTIDFAFLPMLALDDADPAADLQVRVPILHHTTASPQPKLESEEPEPVMKPQISTMSADAIFLPMSDLADGHGMNIDFHAMADRVASNLRRMRVPVEQRAGLMKQIWNDMVDDLVKGSSLKPTSTAS